MVIGPGPVFIPTDMAIFAGYPIRFWRNSKRIFFILKLIAMNRTYLIILALILLSGSFEVPVYGQQSREKNSDRTSAVHLFMDCEDCDMNHIRREIPYVNYVRDVKEADVYVLETSQSTGSGGREYTFTFVGQRAYEGMNDTLVYHSMPDETYDQTRDGITKIISMGLMKYVARTPYFREVEIGHGGTEAMEEVTDRWNYWVFELEVDPDFEIEESLSSIEWESSANISRITPGWKLELDADQSYERTRYIYEDTTYTRDRKFWGMESLFVGSISDHWSAGAMMEMYTSSYRNMKFTVGVLPAIEYNLFPYEESTRRQLRFLYGIGYRHNQYIDTTIFGKINENLFAQNFNVAYQVKQKWGEINVSAEASSYLHDFSKYRLQMYGQVRIRIFKGLSFMMYGHAAKINDQIALAKGNLDEAEILLELQELETAYSIDGGFGFTYTFGSIYNNIVNPRFGD